MTVLRLKLNHWRYIYDINKCTKTGFVLCACKRQCNDVLRKRISMNGGCVDQILVPKTAITIIIVGNESDEKREHKHIRRLCCWKWKKHSNM